MTTATVLQRLDRFDRFVLGVIGALALAIVLVVALGDRVGAQVALARPAAGASLGAHGSIALTFSEAMDAASVESHFSIDPPVAGTFQWGDRSLTFVPAQPFQRGDTVTVRLAAGAESQTGRRQLADQAWSFTVREPVIVYLSASQDTPRELWRIDPTSLQQFQLSHTDGRVFDFAAAPDGESVVFSVMNDQNGTDFWQVGRDGSEPRVILACGADLCSGASWSADGTRIAYSREPSGLSPGAPKGPPRVWTFSVADGQTAPLYQDTQIIGYSPAWSSDGTWLGMVDNSSSAIRLLRLSDQRELLLETQQGTMGTFAPDGSRLIYTTLTFDDATAPQPFTTVMSADLGPSGGLTPILGREYSLADYGTPAWSPDGQWIAINQRTTDSGPSKQVWRMRPDGGEATALTNDAENTYAGYHWSPWSDALVIQRFPLNKAYATPEIVLWSAVDGSIKLLAQNASLPEWLP